ncbi:MAG TPA: hypothetical protein PKD53_14675 [Chloroflexaceae bacterium]|nr:hypothetical protein [Chloroflexaceae bacterium]
MATMKERVPETKPVAAETAAPTASRREMAEWQAQLIAIACTVGMTTLLVLGFSLLTGSL